MVSRELTSAFAFCLSVCNSSLFHVAAEPVILLHKMERWSGCVALVTGGSAGIGAAIVRRLASHGLKVVACARQVGKIQVIE